MEVRRALSDSDIGIKVNEYITKLETELERLRRQVALVKKLRKPGWYIIRCEVCNYQGKFGHHPDCPRHGWHMSKVRSFPLTSKRRKLLVDAINNRIRELSCAIINCQQRHAAKLDSHIAKMQREIVELYEIRETLQTKQEPKP